MQQLSLSSFVTSYLDDSRLLHSSTASQSTPSSLALIIGLRFHDQGHEDSAAYVRCDDCKWNSFCERCVAEGYGYVIVG